MLTKVKQLFTTWKVSIYGVFSGSNTGKYGPEKTTYLDTFHAVVYIWYVFSSEFREMFPRSFLAEHLQWLQKRPLEVFFKERYS